MNCFSALRLGRHSLLRPIGNCTVSRPIAKIPAYQSQFRMASNTVTPCFAEGEDPQQLSSDTAALQTQGWTLDNDGRGVLKTFHFKSYFKAISFVNFIAAESSVKKHHPTMTVRFGSVDVHWTTHQPRGLTHKDISLAQHCDNGAGLIGAVDAGQSLKCGPSQTKS